MLCNASVVRDGRIQCSQTASDVDAKIADFFSNLGFWEFEVDEMRVHGGKAGMKLETFEDFEAKRSCIIHVHGSVPVP